METMSQINPVLLVVVLLLATTEKGISKGKQINTKYHTNLINKYREGNHFELNLEYSIVKDSSADLGVNSEKISGDFRINLTTLCLVLLL